MLVHNPMVNSVRCYTRSRSCDEIEEKMFETKGWSIRKLTDYLCCPGKGE